jgi:uncharacterized protein (DUF1499 family)
MKDMSRPARLMACWLPVCLAACAAPPPAGGPGNQATQATQAALACSLPTRCVNSLGTVGLAPLHYTGTLEQALALLRATLAEDPDADQMRNVAGSWRVIFTTPAGFRDQVDFVIDPQAQRIDYRSRSLFGLYDFGKNASRMRAFAERFAVQSAR